MALGALVAGVGWATYDFGMEFAGFRQGEAARALARLNEEIEKRDAELAELRSKIAAAERQLQIERATYGDLTKQMKTAVGRERALREDLAFFQSLMPAGGKEATRCQHQPRSRAAGGGARRVSLPAAAGADRASARRNSRATCNSS